jgi:hypothetical protein
METEQMMAHLLAEIRTSQEHMKEVMDANQAKAYPNLKEMTANLETIQAETHPTERKCWPGWTPTRKG